MHAKPEVFFLAVLAYLFFASSQKVIKFLSLCRFCPVFPVDTEKMKFCLFVCLISPVFLCTHVTLVAVGLLFWPEPDLGSHLHSSPSPGRPSGCSAAPAVPHPACRSSLACLWAPHQASGHGHWLMGSSVGGSRPEKTHMHTKQTQGHSHSHAHKWAAAGALSHQLQWKRGRRKWERGGTLNRHN